MTTINEDLERAYAEALARKRGRELLAYQRRLALEQRAAEERRAAARRGRAA